MSTAATMPQSSREKARLYMLRKISLRRRFSIVLYQGMTSVVPQATRNQ